MNKQGKGKIGYLDATMRLTKSQIYLNSILLGIMMNFTPICGEERAKETNEFLEKVFDRLKKYEDTGLEPEQITKAQSAMKSALGLACKIESQQQEITDGELKLDAIIRTYNMEHDSSIKEILQFKNEAEKIPLRCGWYEGIGLDCLNNSPYKVNYCPCKICPRFKPKEEKGVRDNG